MSCPSQSRVETFVLQETMPASRPPSSETASLPERAAAPGAGVWALVVEDDLETRGAIASTLEEGGYLVAEAPDGRAALEVLRVSPYSLVALLDYWMPRVDGADVLEAVARDPLLASRHAYIIVTATPELLPPAFAALLRQLDVPVVAKPFDMDELLAVVAQAARRLEKTV